MQWSGLRTGRRRKFIIEIGGHRKRDGADMGKDDGVGGNVRQGKQRRTRDRTAGPQMPLHRSKAHGQPTVLDGCDREDLAVRVKLRKHPPQKGVESSSADM